MSDINDKYHIVYNGEVYNFKEIREELIAIGYKLKTNSDTEVILYSYIQWGQDAVTKFTGMFSIVIYDTSLNELIFINDRLGVKPLYIYKEKDILIFSSEIKAILEYKNFKKKINNKALTQYMKYGYIQPPLSIFENITKIEAGTIMKFNINTQNMTKKIYWDILDFTKNTDSLNINKLHNIIKKAFMYRTISDVPISSFLSSGIDSSLVSAVLSKENNKLNTITIGVENPKYNEAILAKDIASSIGTKHSEYYIKEKDILQLVEEMSLYFDEPFADSSMYPTYIVNKIVSQQYKVTLSADGGDESFGGYLRYIFLKKYYKIIKLPKFIKKILLCSVNIIEKTKILNQFNITSISLKLTKIKNVLNSDNISDMYESLNTYVDNEQIRKVCKNYTFDNGYFKLFDKINKNNNDFLNTAMCIDYKTYLYQVLTKVDRTSMANSIEVREPLLDHNIIEYAIGISSDSKIHDKITKKPLREILAEYMDLNLLTKTKKGFSIPIDIWLRTDLELIVNKYVNKQSILESDIFHWHEVEKIKNKFYNGSNDYIELWHIFIFQMWYDRWVKNIKKEV
jgi:asparagine synthase (glutamine-hydrolysing)